MIEILAPLEEVVDTSYLEYDGRARKRPPGASPTVRLIYGLLVDNIQGLTVSELHDHLREGWSATDAYRAYEKHLTHQRITVGKGSATVIGPYGSGSFREHAQRWWIWSKLRAMQQTRTARHEGRGKGSLWFAGKRAPKVMIACDLKRHLQPYDPHKDQQQQNVHNAALLRREQVKAQLLEGLQNRRLKLAEAKGLIQVAFDHLSGR